MSSIGAAHDHCGIDHHGKRNHVTDKSVRRRIDDYPVIIGPSPIEELADYRRSENRRGINSFRRERCEDIKSTDGAVLNALGEIWSNTFSSRLQYVRETRLFRKFKPPDASLPRTTEVKVDK